MIKVKKTLTLLTVCLLFSGLAFAKSGQEVLKAKGCLNCHDMMVKKMGPSFKDIATKYQNDKNAKSMLVNKLKNGEGHMKVTASDAELNAAIECVLATK